MATHKLWKAIGQLAVIAALISVTSSAWADCARLLGCGTSFQTNSLIRKFNYGDIWSYNPVPSSPYIHFDTPRWRGISQQAMDTYIFLNQYMPSDYIEQDPWGSSDFTWLWTSQQAFLQNPNRRSGIPVAATTLTPDLPDHPCRIKDAQIWFAFDPNDGYTHFCWGDPDCFTPLCWSGTCGYDMLDYLSAAVHEYGHALGMGHSDDGDATMFAAMYTQDTIPRTLKGCEVTFIANKYRDNFGPSRLSAFEATSGTGGQITCSWSAEVEFGCRAYRLTRQCTDGTSTLVADSLFCQGPGHQYVATDTPPCTGLVTYTLSLVDSIAPGLLQEDVLVERLVDLGGGPMPRANAQRVVAEADGPVGFATPTEAVEALGVAISSRDAALRRRVLADGFGYFTREGLYWGRAIDGILEEAMQACLASSDTTIDSLRFSPATTRSLGDNLEEVTANVEYVHRCSSVEATWAGQVVAIVERRRSDEGWRVRQVVESQ